MTTIRNGVFLAAILLSSCASQPRANEEQWLGNNTLRGKVSYFLLSPRGQVEGVLLEDNTSVWFPARYGLRLAAALAIGDPVTITTIRAVPQPSREGRGVDALSITDDRTGAWVVDQAPAYSPTQAQASLPTSEKQIVVSGKITRVLRGDTGSIAGVVLDNNEQVRFAPAIGERLIGLYGARPNATLFATGQGFDSQFGTVVGATDLRYGDTVITEFRKLPAR